MKIKNNYFYKILKIVSWPILFGIGQLLLLFIIGLIYSLFYNVNDFANFINHNSYIIGIINIIVFIPFFNKEYKKYNSKYHKKLKNQIKIILLAIFISFILNELILIVKVILKFEMTINLNIYFLINTIIIGPIIEELLFRGIIFNKLLVFNNEKKSLILTNIIFALMHGDILTIIYAFIMGIILNKIYIKEENLKAPILFHITINFISSFIIPFIHS